MKTINFIEELHAYKINSIIFIIILKLAYEKRPNSRL